MKIQLIFNQIFNQNHVLTFIFKKRQGLGKNPKGQKILKIAQNTRSNSLITIFKIYRFINTIGYCEFENVFTCVDLKTTLTLVGTICARSHKNPSYSINL